MAQAKNRSQADSLLSFAKAVILHEKLAPQRPQGEFEAVGFPAGASCLRQHPFVLRATESVSGQPLSYCTTCSAGVSAEVSDRAGLSAEARIVAGEAGEMTGEAVGDRRVGIQSGELAFSSELHKISDGLMGALRSEVAAAYASSPPQTAASRPAQLCSP